MYKTHGLSYHPLFSRWLKIKDRCLKPNNPSYPHYGGRGITMCDEWKNDFKAFYDWCMANGYAPNLTIDRIDNNGNYEPSNCRFVDMYVQANNKTNNHLIEINGVTKTLAQWCREYNVDYFVTEARIRQQGYSPLKELTSTKKYMFNGELKTLKQICQEVGMPYKAVHLRITRLGWPFDKAISEPLQIQNKIMKNG